ncbi:MAG: DUF3520 domain-containing protein [Verrucomicrobia bacterium]|nr:DUF3520 domain-containing protein [Verrucomicrobiota bacterium]
MNPELPNNPREELELRITALLLGELSTDEATAVREAIAKDVELTRLHDDLKQTIVLVREASSMKEAASPQAETLKLSEERRQKLLTAFKIPPLKEEHRKPRRLFQFTLLEAMAVIAVLGLLAAVLLPDFIKARTTSQRNSVVNNLRQLDGAKQQWALENNKPADAQPTFADIQPYMGRSSGDLPSAVAGEKYVLGKVGEPPSAVMEGDRSRSWFGALRPESKSTARVTLPQDADSDTRGRTYASSRKSRENQTITASVPIDVENGFYAGVKAVPPPVLPVSPPIPGSLAPAVQSSTKIELPALATAEFDAANSFALQPPLAPESRQIIVNSLSAGGGASGGGVGRDSMVERVPVLGDLPIVGKQFERAGRGDIGLQGGINGIAKSQSKGAVALSVESPGAVALDESIPTTPGLEPVSVLGIPAHQDSAQVLAYGITDATKDKEGKASDSYRIAASSEARQKAPDKSNRATSKNWSIATNSSGAAVARYYTGTEREQLARKGDATLAIADGPKNLGEAVRQSVAVDALDVLPAEQNAPTDAKSADNLRSQGTRPYLIHTGGRRDVIVKKLDRIRFDQVAFERLGLGEVLRQLSDEAKKHDSEKKGINLLVSPSVPMTVDPTTGAPLAAVPAPVDISTVAVNLNLKGGNIRLADLLDAIVKGADQPLKYSIEDYAVVFSRADPPSEVEQLLTRTYKIDPNKLNQGLESVFPLFVTKTNSVEERQTAVRVFFSTLGVDLDPAKGKAVHWNDHTGTLLVRATPDELEVVESATQVFGPTTAVEQDVAPVRKPSTNAPIPQPEIQTSENNFSTFSLNVSDVSFKLAAASLEKGQMPDAASVRSEEFINAFDYRDAEAKGGAPIAFAWERARYPFAHNRDLLRFSLKTAAAGRQAGRPLNIVLLLDNSGSMERADRVLIRREALRVLASQLQPQDKLSVITFARTARLVVGGVAGDKAGEVLDQVSSLTPEGGTNLEEAMNLAYQIAAKHYLASGINRVVLLTDGAANLGDVEPASLKQKVEAQRKQGIALDCFGIGWEGFNDDLLEVLSRNGDGRYGFLNSPEEAATDFAGQLAGALKVAASDVKVQVEFNPKRVTSYRQIGYAKHQLTKEQFRDNTVDAAEIAAQEAGNALYTVESNPAGEGPLATVRVRYKVPGTIDYREQSWDVPFTGNAVSMEQSSPAMRLAASASAFSEWLVASPFAGEVKPDALLGFLRGVPEIYGADARPKKLEWMIRQAKSVAGQ